MSDLTETEQANVREAMRFLRIRCGGLQALADALKVKRSTVSHLSNVTTKLAFRAARLAGVSVDDMLSGKYPPPGTCPNCGHRKGDPIAAR